MNVVATTTCHYIVISYSHNLIYLQWVSETKQFPSYEILDETDDD